MGDIGLVAQLTPRSTIDLLRRAGAGTSGRGGGEHGWRGERRQSARHGGRGRPWGHGGVRAILLHLRPAVRPSVGPSLRAAKLLHGKLE